MTEEREKEIAIRGDKWASTKTADRGGYYFAGLSEGYYNGYLEATKEQQEGLTKAKELLTKAIKNTWSIDCFVVDEINKFLNSKVEK